MRPQARQYGIKKYRQNRSRKWLILQGKKNDAFFSDSTICLWMDSMLERREARLCNAWMQFRESKELRAAEIELNGHTPITRWYNNFFHKEMKMTMLQPLNRLLLSHAELQASPRHALALNQQPTHAVNLCQCLKLCARQTLSAGYPLMFTGYGQEKGRNAIVKAAPKAVNAIDSGVRWIDDCLP